jgi:hypothetical protein
MAGDAVSHTAGSALLALREQRLAITSPLRFGAMLLEQARVFGVGNAHVVPPSAQAWARGRLAMALRHATAARSCRACPRRVRTHENAGHPGRGQLRSPRRIRQKGMTQGEDLAAVAGQLADLTRTVEEMGSQLKKMREDAASERERSDTQQERIDLAARELAEVSDRLQAAANALRASI